MLGTLLFVLSAALLGGSLGISNFWRIAAASSAVMGLAFVVLGSYGSRWFRPKAGDDDSAHDTEDATASDQPEPQPR